MTRNPIVVQYNITVIIWQQKNDTIQYHVINVVSLRASGLPQDMWGIVMYCNLHTLYVQNAPWRFILKQNSNKNTTVRLLGIYESVNMIRWWFFAVLTSTDIVTHQRWLTLWPTGAFSNSWVMVQDCQESSWTHLILVWSIEHRSIKY